MTFLLVDTKEMPATEETYAYIDRLSCEDEWPVLVCYPDGASYEVSNKIWRKLNNA